MVAAADFNDFDPAVAHPAPFPNGAAMHTDARAWVLLDDEPACRLGSVLAWADQRGVAQVDLFVDDAAGTLARRAQCFTRPLTVWQVEGRAANVVEADPPPRTAEPSAAALDLVETLRDAGLDIVIEHGRVRGEVLGLEVARVRVDDGDAQIEVGVGRHDREAFALVHGAQPTAEALGDVVAQVRRHRRPGDLTHPLARLAGERWLRNQVLRQPELVGATQLEPADATVEPTSVKQPSPAIAVGRTETGSPLVVACSIGVDLDLVPAAADARLTHAPGADLRLVVPERDAVPVTRRLAATLVQPAEIVTVPDDFRR